MQFATAAGNAIRICNFRTDAKGLSNGKIVNQPNNKARRAQWRVFTQKYAQISNEIAAFSH